jgi:hypothetical protein
MYVGDYGNGMRDACIDADSTFSADIPLPLKARAADAWINALDLTKRVDGYIRQRIFDMFDSAGELAMNDAMIAAEVQGEERTEAHDFVEMGRVSEETKGGLTGLEFDGVPFSRWN